MKNVLKNYLQKLAHAGTGLEFISIHCRYGKFTIYCLVGPEENIIHLAFTAPKHDRAQKQLAALDDRIFFKTVQQEDFSRNKLFNDYFSGKQSNMPIEINSPFIDAGSGFQQRVWQHISAIPYGETITYQRLAELAGSPKGARAAGTACGANPLPIIIPCHRVVANNSIGGFGGGIPLKKSLLALEKEGSRKK
ncbi:MAG: MGMT family protein [Deltaproteobacteria bacterium]|jgi:methylated-DNA-[protein]-cysteine S-methyltransferase|nr:MGMT family protein [Deltaproteobacteria bacterium]